MLVWPSLSETFLALVCHKQFPNQLKNIIPLVNFIQHSFLYSLSWNRTHFHIQLVQSQLNYLSCLIDQQSSYAGYRTVIQTRKENWVESQPCYYTAKYYRYQTTGKCSIIFPFKHGEFKYFVFFMIELFKDFLPGDLLFSVGQNCLNFIKMNLKFRIFETRATKQYQRSSEMINFFGNQLI